MKRARALRDMVILANGTIAEGATVVRKWDSLEMADGGDLPELSADDVMADEFAAPGHTRHRLPQLQRGRRRE